MHGDARLIQALNVDRRMQVLEMAADLKVPFTDRHVDDLAAYLLSDVAGFSHDTVTRSLLAHLMEAQLVRLGPGAEQTKRMSEYLRTLMQSADDDSEQQAVVAWLASMQSANTLPVGPCGNTTHQDVYLETRPALADHGGGEAPPSSP